MKAYTARHALQLVVADLVVTEAFYAGILELPVQRSFTAPGAPDHLVVDMGQMAIVFVEEDDVIRTHPVLQHRLGMFPHGVGVTLHFEVHDLEGISDALQEEGLEILYPLQLKPFSIKELWCFDPDGYLIVLDEVLEKKKRQVKG